MLAGGLLSLREIIRYRQTCINLSGLVLSDRIFPDTVSTILTCAETFGVKYGTAFLKKRKKNIVEDLQAVKFLHGRNFNNCQRQIRIAKFFPRCPTARSLLETESKAEFGITHLQNRTLLSSVRETAVLVLRAADRHVSNPEQSKDAFFARAFNSTAARYVSPLHAVFTTNCHAKMQRFPATPPEFHVLLQCKLTKTKT